ncbi:Major facilitator superfamily domain general substrate transporter [Penicillium concentricum]|uniref:Major facilitator superfamily domain general substrate transporter n=1 Tax=Penicillium concentricum TaxID=293559 RepID=A0A9W9R8K5_9EURO|nr:Major facilitator superfamily domain general substrate transporter [Penicillium concentricum]KAJ5355642.1 Major facilitator superfamily domain general substrate transporter [Penicillium concentricum]
MSLNRISFLEGWERNPAAFLGHPESEDSDPDSYQDLPEGSVSSSFPSTYSRLNFNPYAGPGWNESPEDPHDDRSSFFGSFLGLSPTTTREGRAGSGSAQGLGSSERIVHEDSGTVSRTPPWADTTGAYEVSAARRIAQVCTAVVYCFLAAGIVFGFAALKPVLIREKVYRNLCSQTELEEDVDVCYGQEIRLNLMFTIAAVITNVSALPVGTILDAYGPRVSGIIGSICLAIGAVLFGTASNLPFDGYIPGYLFLALGGPFVFIPSFHLSNTFPTRSGLILSMLTGAFDASSALFLLFRLLSEQTEGLVSINNFFAAYLIVPIFIIAAQIFIMPPTSYKTAGELVQQAEAQVEDEIRDRIDDTVNDRSEGERQRMHRRLRRQSIVSHIQDLLDDGTASVISDNPIDNSVFHTNIDTEINLNTPRGTHGTATPHSHTQQQQTTPNPPPGGIWGVLHGHSALYQLRTPWFGLITAFTVLMMLRINYFVATLRSQYTYLLSPEAAAQINTTFDILLPIGGLVSVPFIGTFLDKFQTRTVLFILVVSATTIGVLGCIPYPTAAYGNIILFVLYRPFYYTAVSDYAAKVFGFATFGKVYGLIICLAGVGNFAQAGLDALTLRVWRGDPVPVNVGLTVLIASVGGGLVGFVAYQTGVLEGGRRGDGDQHRSTREREPLLRNEEPRGYGA